MAKHELTAREIMSHDIGAVDADSGSSTGADRMCPSPLVRFLLMCGIAIAPLYILTDIVAAAFFYPGYDYTAQQVSELSAIGAPSRGFWMLMGWPYGLLTLAFAVGVWLAADHRPNLKAAAVLVALFGAVGFAWSWVAPMHMRGTEFTDTDAMHIMFAVATIVLMLGFIGLAARALSGGFRVYSAATVVALLVTAGVISTQIGAIAQNQPTPWMGLIERISVYAPLIWLAVLALTLPRRSRDWRHASGY